MCVQKSFPGRRKAAVARTDPSTSQSVRQNAVEILFHDQHITARVCPPFAHPTAQQNSNAIRNETIFHHLSDTLQARMLAYWNTKRATRQPDHSETRTGNRRVFFKGWPAAAWEKDVLLIEVKRVCVGGCILCFPKFQPPKNHQEEESVARLVWLRFKHGTVSVRRRERESRATRQAATWRRGDVWAGPRMRQRLRSGRVRG